MTMSKATLDHYLNLPYKIEIAPEPDGSGFTATIPALKGSVAFGETIEEALETIDDVKRNWIEIALERGWQVPEPVPEELREYSGKFSLRLPRYLHRRLSDMAEQEGTSLNQLIVAMLSEGAERRRQAQRFACFKARISEPDLSDIDELIAGFEGAASLETYLPIDVAGLLRRVTQQPDVG